MDKKTQELIAIGAAVTANCVPCFKFHFAKAREELASDDEIREAVRVGRMVRKGAAKTWDDEIGKILA
jgi:AhpD family alkylhydroperoxidase